MNGRARGPPYWGYPTRRSIGIRFDKENPTYVMTQTSLKDMSGQLGLDERSRQPSENSMTHDSARPESVGRLDGQDDTSPPLLRMNVSPEARRGASMSDSAMSIADGVAVFHTADLTPYASVPVDNHFETHEIRSKGFSHWLGYQHYKQHGRSLNNHALQEAVDHIAAKAMFEGLETEVHTRIAHGDGVIYIDLCDREWRVLVVDGTGTRMETQPSIKFRRTKGMAPLPLPLGPGNPYDLKELLSLDSESWTLVAGWMISALRPTGPYPVLHLSGEQGSSKSTTARLIRSFIDPSTAPLREAPRSSRDLMLAATNSWILAFDNVSRIPEWLSDSLCRLSTGGGFSTRQLYQDTDEIILDAMRPVILTGIGDLANRDDLADRSLVVTLPQIRDKDRVPEDLLWKRYEASRTKAFVGLLEVLSRAIRELPNTELVSYPRMADFVQWVSASETAFGWQKGRFEKSYADNRDKAVAVAVEDNPIASAICTLMDGQPEWEGTMTELSIILRTLLPEHIQKSRSFPTAANRLSNEVRRAATFLRKIGIEINPNQKRDGKRLVTIRRTDAYIPSSPSSPSSTSFSDNERSSRDGLTHL